MTARSIEERLAALEAHVFGSVHPSTIPAPSEGGLVARVKALGEELQDYSKDKVIDEDGEEFEDTDDDDDDDDTEETM